MSVCHKHSVIGVLDSGVGGLTHAHQLKDRNSTVFH